LASKTYADYAYEKMIDLYNNHSNEVGSELYNIDPVKGLRMDRWSYCRTTTTSQFTQDYSR